MSAYRVVAPYVTLPIVDGVSGKAQVHGFYAGAIVSGVEDGDIIKRHVESGMVELFEAPKAESAPKAELEPKAEAKPKPEPKSAPAGS